MAFPRLQELIVAEHSNNLTDAMSVYIQRKNNDDLQFAARLNGDDDVGLYLLWFYVHGDDDVGTWFEAQPGLGMSFATRPKLDREAITTTAALAGGSVTTRSIAILEVIDDCMSPQCTNSSEDKTQPPATHGTRSPTSKSLTKLNIEDHEHPIITTIQIPQRGMNFLESYGYMGPMLILIQIPHLLHLEGKLFESRGCLFLVCIDDIGSSEFTIYEMMIGCSVWPVRYRVDTDDFMTPLPEAWSIRSTVWSIVLGEREEDSFLVINLSGKVVQYNLVSKTLHEIYDCGSNQLDDNHDDDDDELLQQFEAEYNVYEFIPSFSSV
ncbi:hypothetical protein Tco_0988708 [Tanacetum coccineum]|uniref:Uncharacterized protein n=1 Tax=Tanacetum coccineum TaxID=301880 RepID=A0ABQ5ES36_9ASTR